MHGGGRRGLQWARGDPRPLSPLEQAVHLPLMSPEAALAPCGPDPVAPKWGLGELASTHQAGPEPPTPAVGEGSWGGPLGTPALPQALLPERLQGEAGDVLPPSEVGLEAGGSASLGSPGGGGASI